MRCFVPNCENTEGVPFPQDEELKNIWLKSLNVLDVLPDDGSFVCLSHFEKDDIEEFINDENFIEKRVRAAGIPKLLPNDNVSEESTFQLNSQDIESPQNDSESSNFYIPVNEESSAQSDTTEVQQNSSNGEQEDLENSNQNVDQKNETESFSDKDQDATDSLKSDGNENVASEEGETSARHALPDVPQTLHDDVEIDKETQMEVFQEYQEKLLDGNYLESKDNEAEKNQDKEAVQEEDSLVKNDFLSMESEFHSQEIKHETMQEQQETVQLYSPNQAVVFTSGNEEMFVSEGQNIFTTAGQHVYVAEGQTLLTSEGQQVFVTEGQTVFTTNGQQVFVTAGQTLLTEDGQQVFLEGDDQSFNEQSSYITTDENFQHSTEGNEGTESSQEGMHIDQKTDEEKVAEMELLKQHAMAEKQIQDQSSVLSKGNFGNSAHLVINEQLMTEEYNANMEQNESMDCQNIGTNQENVGSVANLLVKKEVDNNESPRNIVMEWFVPTNQKAQPATNFSGILGAKQNPQLASQHRLPHGVQRLPGARPIKRHAGMGTIAAPKKPNIEQNSDETCRLCGLAQEKYINILDNIRSNVMILEAIQLCIHPLEVSLEDPFSKKICIGCFNSLQKYYEFRQKCLEMNLTQRRLYEKAHPNYKFPDKPKPLHQYMTEVPKRTHMRTVMNQNKQTGYKQTEVLTVTQGKGNGAKNITRKIILTPTHYKKHDKTKKEPMQRVVSRTNKFDNLQVFKPGSSSGHNNSKTPTKTASPRPNIPVVNPKAFSASQLEAMAKKHLSPEKQLRVQEELRKVVEGKMSKDELSVDQVIVRVVSDDDSDDAEYLPQKRRKVVIPRGIRVSVPDRIESGKGVFPCFKKLGAFDTEFSLIDGYLFEHRLCRGKERFLKCISSNCPSKATQKMISPDIFENKAEVTIAHNHHPLTTTEIKKQMFYYIMKKKMQADKGTNFRNIYDQICHKDPEIAVLVPLRSLINEICKHQLTQKVPPVESFDDFYNIIEDDALQKFQFTFSGKQFYQERFTVEEDGAKAVVFANVDTIKKVSNSKLMYVDASFRIDSSENFSYQLVTVLVWIDDSYYPIMFALVSKRTMEIFKKIFGYLHDTLAPNLCPEEIVTDYEANIYYALGETYLDSHIGGSVFYYTQNLYKKICELGLSKELETTSYFRNIYHMLLMLPLLPVNTIADGLQNIEIQAYDLGISSTVEGLIEHIREQWMEKVTPDLFCVHRLENRINENVIAPFKKLRDFLMLNKGKNQRQSLTLVSVVEKLIELENFLQTTYSSENKRSFGRDLSSSQKKNVLKAWHYIESHPKININHFFTKVIGYIKCMENQLWIWGYYKFSGKVTDDLINASNFSIVNTNETETVAPDSTGTALTSQPGVSFGDDSNNALVMDAVVGPSGEFVLSSSDTNQESESSIFKYVYKNDT